MHERNHKMTKEQFFILARTHKYFTPELLNKTLIDMKKVETKTDDDKFAKTFLIHTLELYKQNIDLVPYAHESIKLYTESIIFGNVAPSFALRKLNEQLYRGRDEIELDIAMIGSCGFKKEIELYQADIKKMKDRIQALNDKMDVQAIQTFKSKRESRDTSDYKTNIITKKQYLENEIKFITKIIEEFKRMHQIWLQWFNRLTVIEKGYMKQGICNEHTINKINELKSLLYM